MSTIKCRTCGSSMFIERCESSAHAKTCWHHCPVCKQVRLTSEYESASLAPLTSAPKKYERTSADDNRIPHITDPTL